LPVALLKKKEIKKKKKERKKKKFCRLIADAVKKDLQDRAVLSARPLFRHGTILTYVK